MTLNRHRTVLAIEDLLNVVTEVVGGNEEFNSQFSLDVISAIKSADAIAVDTQFVRKERIDDVPPPPAPREGGP